MIQRINHLNLEHQIGLNDESKGQYDNNNKFKKFIIRSNLCDDYDAYLVTVPNMVAAVAAVNNTNKNNI